jgi:hypothetical protein
MTGKTIILRKNRTGQALPGLFFVDIQGPFSRVPGIFSRGRTNGAKAKRQDNALFHKAPLSLP